VSYTLPVSMPNGEIVIQMPEGEALSFAESRRQ
jgi:hypothetical protein